MKQERTIATSKWLLLLILSILLLVIAFLCYENSRKEEYITVYHKYLSNQPAIQIEYAEALINEAISEDDEIEKSILLQKSLEHIKSAREHFDHLSRYYSFAGKLEKGWGESMSFTAIGSRDFFTAYEVKVTKMSMALIDKDSNTVAPKEELLALQTDLSNIQDRLSEDIYILDGFELHALFKELVKEAKTPDLFFGVFTNES